MAGDSGVERRRDVAGEHGSRRRELCKVKEYREDRAEEGGGRELCRKAEGDGARRNARRIRDAKSCFMRQR